MHSEEYKTDNVEELEQHKMGQNQYLYAFFSLIDW